MIRVQWPQSGALVRRLEEIQRRAAPSSPVVRAYRADVAAAVQDDHIAKMTRNVDRYGARRADLAESTLKRKRKGRPRGPGPSLIPLNMVSRFITLHRVYWHEQGGIWLLTAGWDDFVSAKGFPIPVAHMTGASKPLT